MRLRPSGRQGPVATSWPAFQSYQREEAWTWEHLALTRARVVSGAGNGAADLAGKVEAFRGELIAGRRDDPKVLPDVAEMRARLALAKAGEGPWDVKSGAGRLRDVELVAQGLALLSGSPERATADQLAAGLAMGRLSEDGVATLAEAADLYARVQAASRLLTEGALDPDKVGEGGRRFLLRETGEETIESLVARLTETAERAAAVIDDVLGGTT
jgi:glutamate-ammonia-ligase adenylyltransferase